jgi:hypothetical protein
MNRKTDHLQLAFPWLQDKSSSFPSNRTKSRIRKLQWPPKIGQKLAFKCDFGIQMGILRQIKQGLVCRQYTMADGQIAMEHELVMSASGPRRHPSTVTETELKSCVARVQAARNDASNGDLRQNPEVWSDFCQIVGYVALKEALDVGRKEHAIMENTPTPRAS